MTPRTYIVDSPAKARVLGERITKLDTKSPWEILVRKYRRLRNLSQNRYYWRLLQLAAEQTGNEAEDLHEFFKLKYLEPITVSIGGQAKIVASSTTRLKTDEFAEFCNRVESFLVSEGIWLDG